MSKPGHTHVLVAGRGYWGRGETFHEAVKNARWLNKGDKVFTAACHPETYINDMGQIVTPQGEGIEDFTHGTIAGTSKAFKFVPKKG